MSQKCWAGGVQRQGWSWNWRAKERRTRTKRQLVGVSSQLCIVEVPRTSMPPQAERVTATSLHLCFSEWITPLHASFKPAGDPISSSSCSSLSLLI